ncbi:GntR family transcriptional regulator [Pilibacter termitis]|uniref:GntR family transcriptional regulator n=1 Tax=Pilibacter termitis TaxID=263852 RepID=A0A1T4QEP1_9ENTE|nr:GntR family transcriptional regulator, LSA1692 subfamily [Pilibacter termitis]SKA01971.1 GntR family transcriptional regulator [Pilibacter termitis]
MKKALYKQIEEKIEERILANEYGSRNRLPSEYELAEEFAVSRLTIRKALQQLIDKKMLYRRENAGLYVMSKPKIVSGKGGLHSFSEVAKKQGKSVHTRVLDFQEIPYQQEIWEELEAAEEEKILHITRIRSLENEPMTIEELWIRRKYLPEKLSTTLFTQSIFQLIEQKIKLAYSHQEIEGRVANKKEADLLKIKENSAILHVHSITYGVTGVPILVDSSFYRADKYKFQTTYIRNGEEK